MVLRIYIPTTESNAQQWVTETLSTLSLHFGGATAYAARGTWLSAFHALLDEQVTVCEAFADDSKLQKALPVVRQLCEKIKAELRQESVLYTIQAGDAHFV